MIEERIELASADSTNNVALGLIREDLDHGILVVADKQEAGRGRLGRAWASPKGNLYCSILLPPYPEEIVDPRLSLLAANAVYETVAEFIRDSAALSIKWPNDILIGNKKVSGILVEACNRYGKGFAVVGVGINIVAETIKAVPPEIAHQVTALQLEGDSSSEREEVLASLLKHFELWHERFIKQGAAPVCEFWNRHCGSIGRELEVPSLNTVGIHRGVNEQGQLLVESENGIIAIESDEVREPLI
jgi:BirA family biotin operon repressor/biotin-[acetyl-CoA-carboxylase] ligase